MHPFMGKHFLLNGRVAIRLYHRYASRLPVFDFHCHLSAKTIAEDRPYENLTQLWLSEDHYKWRVMRAWGIEERLVTGDASDAEKFTAFASLMPYLIGNPLYHWCHLELRRFFGITACLNAQTASAVYAKCNRLLQRKKLSPKKLLAQSRVRFLATTDDPLADLSFHRRLQADPSFSCTVVPSFRMDSLLAIDDPAFPQRAEALVRATQPAAGDSTASGDGSAALLPFATWLQCILLRLNTFFEAGARATDCSLEDFSFEPFTDDGLAAVFQKALKGIPVTRRERHQYQSALLVSVGKAVARRGGVFQLHIGALRNPNALSFSALGPDSGFDTMDDLPVAQTLTALFNAMEVSGELPKTVLYCLNPKDNPVLASLIGSFQGGGIIGKIQFGAAWWFNDHIDGIREQLSILSQMGVLSTFIGMVTDSRSILSYTRHEYFRRILCNLIGEWVERGEYPNKIDFLGKRVADIAFYNAARYFLEEPLP